LRNGADHAVVGAIRTHLDSEVVAEHGSAIIELLAFDDGSEARLLRCGAASALLDAMLQHQHSPRIQVAGCRAVWKFNSQRSRADIAVEQPWVAILLAMEAHLGDVSVQKWATKALWNLSGNEETRQLLVEAGAYRAVVHAQAVCGGLDGFDFAGEVLLALSTPRCWPFPAGRCTSM